jgi:indole-3-glycerol phosphate synthase
MSILNEIVEFKKTEVGRLPAGEVSLASLQAAVAARGGTRDFFAALASPRSGDVGLIAEVKKASPSAGIIRLDFDPVKIALEYERAGASCLSVLTDEKYFQGSLEYLKAIREAVSLPLLRKDFMVDERQILEAIEWGADAILLIVSCLTDETLAHFHELATGAGLTALVEVHDAAELDRALAVGARLIGVNNRDLKTFTVDLGTTVALAGKVAAQIASGEILFVAESGIHTRADVERLTASGAKAILVGESLMRQADIRVKAHELIGLG